MEQTIRVGVVGFGISAKVFHLPFITRLPGFQLSAILERSRSESKEQYPQARIVRTIDELVADPNIDLVVVTTPNDTHYEYTAKALRAGKHVVLEKPVTNTSREALELIEIARASGKILSVYHNRRYVSDFLTIRDILSGKLLGDVHEYTAHYDRYRAEARPNAWREEGGAGSGILYDLGPHLIDQALVFFGHPQWITAEVRRQRPHAKADDYFHIWLDYGTKRIILHAGMLVREPGPRYMIHGTLGSFIKSGEDPQEALLRQGIAPTGSSWGSEPTAFYGLLHTEVDGKVVRETVPSAKGDFGRYYTNLYDAIVNGAPLQERAEDGYNTIRIIELALESNTLKRTVACDGLI